MHIFSQCSRVLTVLIPTTLRQVSEPYLLNFTELHISTVLVQILTTSCQLTDHVLGEILSDYQYHVFETIPIIT